MLSKLTFAKKNYLIFNKFGNPCVLKLLLGWRTFAGTDFIDNEGILLIFLQRKLLLKKNT